MNEELNGELKDIEAGLLVYVDKDGVFHAKAMGAVGLKEVSYLAEYANRLKENEWKKAGL